MDSSTRGFEIERTDLELAATPLAGQHRCRTGPAIWGICHSHLASTGMTMKLTFCNGIHVDDRETAHNLGEVLSV